MPSQEDLHKFKMSALGYDPLQEEANKLAQAKLQQQQMQVQQPQVSTPPVPVVPQSNDTGMPNLDMDAARNSFFVNLQKLLNRG